MDEIGEDAVRRDGACLKIRGTEVNRKAGEGHRNDERESGGEALEVEPNPMLGVHVPGIHPRGVVFRDEVVVYGIRWYPRVHIELPLIKVERGDPQSPVLVHPRFPVRQGPVWDDLPYRTL